MDLAERHWGKLSFILSAVSSRHGPQLSKVGERVSCARSEQAQFDIEQAKILFARDNAAVIKF